MAKKNIDNFIGQITNGDSAVVLSTIKSNSVDLVVTSPPYDELRDYNNDSVWDFNSFKKIARQLYRVVKDGGVVVWVVGDSVVKGNKSLSSFKQALYFQQIGFNMFDVIIYEKAGTAPPHKNRYFNAFEYMFVLSKGNPKTINLLEDKPNKWANHSTFGNVTRREQDGTLTPKGRKVVKPFGVRTNIWRYNNGKGFSTKDKIAYEHPAIFPEKLAQDHIISWSNEGDIVLDPFCGSGTVAKVASLLNRKWVGIEISSEYCKIANERLGLVCTEQLF
ncbi:MAG: site-specific DNA-methyltransferase [Alistipes sp.]|nr:site-specific DNA-methyltransferase [Alistipes sp.]